MAYGTSNVIILGRQPIESIRHKIDLKDRVFQIFKQISKSLHTRTIIIDRRVTLSDVSDLTVKLDGGSMLIFSEK